MNNTLAIATVEKKLGIERPKLGKGETEFEISLEAHEFNKLEDFTVRAKGEDEVCVQVTGSPQWARPGTLEDPPEGGYSEDVTVWLGNEDITELLVESVYESICEKHYDDADGVNDGE